MPFRSASTGPARAPDDLRGPAGARTGHRAVFLFSDSVIVGNVLGTIALGFDLLAFNVSSWVPGLVSTAVRYVSPELLKTRRADAVRHLPSVFGVRSPLMLCRNAYRNDHGRTWSGDDPLFYGATWGRPGRRCVSSR